MISSNTNSSCVASCRLAPVTTIDNGTPRPSTRRCRLVPPVGWIPTNRFLSQGSLDHGSFDTLPAPFNTLHFVIFGESCSPERHKKTGTHPSHKMSMNSTLTTESLLRQSFPPNDTISLSNITSNFPPMMTTRLYAGGEVLGIARIIPTCLAYLCRKIMFGALCV